MKSHIPVVNAPERIDIPFEEDSSKPFQLKSSTSNPRKRGSPSASIQNESNIKAPTNISGGHLKRSKRKPKNKSKDPVEGEGAPVRAPRDVDTP